MTTYKKKTGDTFLRTHSKGGFYGGLLIDTTRKTRLLTKRGQGGKYQTLLVKIEK